MRFNHESWEINGIFTVISVRFDGQKCEFDEIETNKNMEALLVSSSIMGYFCGSRVELHQDEKTRAQLTAMFSISSSSCSLTF